MSPEELLHRLRELCREDLPLPGSGATAERHHRLLGIGREDLSLARLAEAHFDAVAILAEAGRQPAPDAVYGVWAAEIPGQSIRLLETGGQFALSGFRKFASGATLVDRALVTVEAPHPWLVDVDLRKHGAHIAIDPTTWKIAAFAATMTSTVEFQDTPVAADSFVGERGWYLKRPGFWNGAIGPAACWAGGAIGILDYAREQTRSDPHTLAHFGAMEAAAWALQGVLDVAGREIDGIPLDREAAQKRALRCRHIVEQLSMEILERFGRAYGPHPLVFVEEVSNRYQELTIYLRQCHAERDLAALGALSFSNKATGDNDTRERRFS